MVIYVDVDDTLVRFAGSKKIPMTIAIDRVRKLALEGASLYLWSTGGGEYAKSMAVDLGIADCFKAFLPKPQLIIDDQPIHEWRDFKHSYPLEG